MLWFIHTFWHSPLCDSVWSRDGVGYCRSTRAKLSGPHRGHIQNTGFVSIFIFPSRGTNGTYGLINVTSKRAPRQKKKVSSFVIEVPKNVTKIDPLDSLSLQLALDTGIFQAVWIKELFMFEGKLVNIYLLVLSVGGAS